MSEPKRSETSGVRTGLTGAGALALIVGCCAAVPLLVALAGSVAVGAILGLAAGAVVLIALGVLLAMRMHRRAARETHQR